MVISRFVIVVLFLFHSGGGIAGDLLNIPQHIWDGLHNEHRSRLSERYLVNVMAGNTYGTILDAQNLNESTAGSSAGTELGSRYMSAAYVDNAFKGSPRNWNYSATQHLSAEIIGAAIGSLANQPGQKRYRSRYTIKNGNGGVEYIEEIRSDAFRHSVALCVAIGPIRPIELDTCNQTQEQFLAKHAWLAKPEIVTLPIITPLASPTSSGGSSDMVLCKFGMASPIRIDASVCEAAGGVSIP